MTVATLQANRTEAWHPGMHGGEVDPVMDFGVLHRPTYWEVEENTPRIFRAAGTGSMACIALTAVLAQPATAPHGNSLYALLSEAKAIQQMVGQQFGNEIKSVSGLTNELIAPMLGVSRRSFQSWLAGDPLSARNEQRLRGTLAALKALGSNPAEVKERLFDRAKHSVRLYDMLVEGHYDAVISVFTGVRHGALRKRPAHSESIAAQVSRDPGSLPSSGKLDRKLSGTLRR